MASKHRADDLEAPPGKRTKVPFLKPGLNRLDCNLDFTVETDGLTGSALHKEGFAYCWSGARANIGVKGGKYCFGCKVLSNQTVTMEDTAKDQQNVCRVGVSRGDDDIGSLGESANSFGYGGTGKFSHSGTFSNYGGKFGAGDVIICAVDMGNPSGAKVSFAKNGKWLGVAMEFDAGPRGLDVIGASDYKRAFFPHILLKNVKVRVMLSIDHGLVPLEGFKPWDCAVDDGNAVEGPRAIDGENCEVIMMVGLPGSGKTTWAEGHAREHPEKRYMLLGTNLALDQMKVPGLLRKKNYGERFERLMDRASKIFNQLMDRAAKTSRNFIIDQTNVYRSARVRKLKPFRDFYKVAVVVFPHPHELKKRTAQRAIDMGKEVPQEAVQEMLANFVLPNTKGMLNSIEPFDEVSFVELERDDAERYLAEMKSSLPAKPFKKSESTPASSFQGSYHDRNVKEGSTASFQGSYTSSYELQDYKVREPARVPVARSDVSYGSSYPSFNRDPHLPSREQFNVQRPGPFTDLSAHSYYDDQRGYPSSSHSYPVDHPGRYGISSQNPSHYGIVSQDPDLYGIASQDSSRYEIASQDQGSYVASRVPYGSSSGIGRQAMPLPPHYSTSAAGSYSSGVAPNAGRPFHSQTFVPDMIGPPASRSGQPMPPMPPRYQY